MKKPLVSVVIPTRDRADLVGKAVGSALGQTLRDIEVIVVDDGSRDNTREAVKSFGDPRVVYVRHRASRGGSAARNTGITSARGNYIAFLDSDDEWLPEKLERQVSKIAAASADVGIVYTGYWIVGNGNRELGPVPGKKGYIFEDELLTDYVSPTSCVLVKKRCFERVGGFDESLPARQDYDLWMRLSKYFCFEYVKEPLVNIFFDSNMRISSSLKNQIQAEQRILEKVKKELESLPAAPRRHIISYHYYRMGKCYCVNGDSSLGRDCFVSAIKEYPFSLRYFLFLVISAFGSGFYRSLSRANKIVRTRIRE